MLKISRGQLEQASAHVATAVEPDSWLRVWLGPRGAGLLYASTQGGVACDEPAGVFRFKYGHSGGLEPLEMQLLEPVAPELGTSAPLQQLVAAATAAWASPGHAGWQVLQLSGARFSVSVAVGWRVGMQGVQREVA